MEKCITKLSIAKRLLELGNKIKRLDYDRKNHKNAVFIFESTEKLYRDLKWIEKEY